MSREIDLHDTLADARLATIRALAEALEPFAHEDLCKELGGNVQGGESIVFQRNKAVLKLKHFRLARQLLHGGDDEPA